MTPSDKRRDVERARELITKWRKEATEYEAIYKARGWDGHFRAQAVKKACADELEAALKGEQQP